MSSLDAVRARFARNEGLPFADTLTEASIRGILHEQGVQFRDRVFSPVTTIWGFLSQVLSEDHSCRDAVSRIIAHRAANGETVCSPNTASYCPGPANLYAPFGWADLPIPPPERVAKNRWTRTGVGQTTGEIMCRERLGGMLRY